MVVRGVAGREGGPRSDHPQDLGWGLVMPLRVATRLLGVLNLSTSVHRDELPATRVSLLGILAMIPLVNGCCCLLGLPAGIWALATLGNQDVKAGFAARSGGAGSALPPPDEF